MFEGGIDGGARRRQCWRWRWKLQNGGGSKSLEGGGSDAGGAEREQHGAGSGRRFWQETKQAALSQRNPASNMNAAMPVVFLCCCLTASSSL
ncbi:hypothetical protein BC567DRAFT_238655 [Phyllosticta citribraziliensis]